MTRGVPGREALVMGLLALLPVLAHAPAWWEARLLGPGDGAALHYPLRVAVWDSYRHLELPSWNPWIFSGMPLLASYRPGALYPPMILAALLPDFIAFQTLVLFSLSASAILTYSYLKRLGAGVEGAYLAGVSFSLGPYLVGHLADTATVVAAPTLPLVLLAAEAYMRRGSPGRAAGLAGAVALLLLAGSPEAAKAGGALLGGRVVVGQLFRSRSGRPSLRSTVLTLLAGGLLAAPQILPTLLLAPEAGRSVTGLAPAHDHDLRGATGLVLRYVSHTPAPSLALAALPLALTEMPVRVLGVALAVCLGLQWGRGPLSAPGALSLVFDLTLAVLAGLSLSAQWDARREALGLRLRAYFLFSSLASAAALSVSAAAVGPLPQTLAGAVGILALGLILYFSLAGSKDSVKAGVWLLPLSVSFLLQPQGRAAWSGAPTRHDLERGTPTRQAVDQAMGLRRSERILTLARIWPREEATDLAFAGLASVAGRRAANGYDPMVPMRYRRTFDGMGVGGTLPGSFFRGDPRLLETLGIRWVQVPASALVTPGDRWGFGDTLDIGLEVGRPRFFPVPTTAVTQVHVASLLSEAITVRHGQPVARVMVRLATGRDLELLLRAGDETGEWAWDRPDVRDAVAHGKPPVLESWPAPEGTYEGHRYRGVLSLPGRYYVDGVRLERLPGAGHLVVSRLALVDTAPGGGATPVSLVAGYVSDAAYFREAAATPAVRLFELPRAAGPARVVERLRLVASDEAVLRSLRSPPGDFDLRREAMAVKGDAAGAALPDGGRASRAEVKRGPGGRLDIQAEGPGLLVVAEGWDPGWSARVDEKPASVLRVNHVQIGVVLTAGFHRVALRHEARGFGAGLLLAAAAALGLGMAAISGKARGER